MKLCMYFNKPVSYRESIYREIDKRYDCDWYFDKVQEDMKFFDTDILKSVHFLDIKSLRQFYLVKGLLALLKKEYDVYIMIGATRNLSLYLFLILKKAFFRKKRVFLWTHGVYGKENKLEFTLLKKPLLEMADGLLLYSNYAKNLMITKGFKAERLFTIHNSLAYDKQLILRQRAKLTDVYKNHFLNSQPVLLFLGRLSPVKRLDMLVKAVKLLKDKGEIYNVVFVGDGGERQHLESLVKSFQINEQFWFYGTCYDETINAELVYNADLCVAPGNIGLTAIHALMFGCPVITHGDFKWQMPEFEAIHPNLTGAFFEHDNIEDLAKTISHWFASMAGNRYEVRQACYKEIDEQWNPSYQMKIIKHALDSI